MRQTIEIIVLACIAVALYFNLTSIPKQDYTCCNNPNVRRAYDNFLIVCELVKDK